MCGYISSYLSVRKRTMVHFVILSLLAVVAAFDTERRCLLYVGTCVTYCPTKMYPYHTKCDGHTVSQRTCDYPIIYSLGYTCGWSRCDCIGDLVFDEQTNNCINILDCPKYTTKLPKLKTAEDRRKSGRKRKSWSKRIKIPQEDINEMT